MRDETMEEQRNKAQSSCILKFSCILVVNLLRARKIQNDDESITE